MHLRMLPVECSFGLISGMPPVLLPVRWDKHLPLKTSAVGRLRQSTCSNDSIKSTNLLLNFFAGSGRCLLVHTWSEHHASRQAFVKLSWMQCEQ